MKGIDVSKWQGVIDYGKVKNAGIDFVFIREGYGKDQTDKKYEQNYLNAKNVGLNVGVYHYSYADSTEDAKKEAEFCITNLRGKKFEYPICFDIEDKEQLKLNNRQRTDIVKSFCDTIENAGYYAMFYCNLNWLKNYLNKNDLSKYDLWLAQWNSDKPSYSCGIWQYSETGKVSGINGNVDLDESYKDYPAIIKSKGLNGFSSTTSTKGSVTSTINSETKTYKVKPGDNLSKIAKQHNTTINKLVKDNNIKDKNKIYVGQVLKV